MAETPPDDFSDELPLTPELVEEEALRGDFAIKWVVILLASLMACTQIAESPTLVHVKSGQYLADHGVLPPANDVFSYTAAERPWVNLSWLFDLVLGVLYSVGSWPGITVLKIVMAGAVFFLLAKISRTNTPTWWNSICAVLALLACHQRLTAQPTLVTLLGITLTLLWLHQRVHGSLSGNRGWWIVPVFFLWSNLDPRMYLGLALLLLYGVGDVVSRLLGISETEGNSSPSPAPRSGAGLWLPIAACLAAAILNPFGWNSLLSPLTVYGAEYPAWHAYFPRNPPSDALLAFSATAPYFGSWNVATVAIVSLAIFSTLLFVLNWSRMDVGYLFVFFGFMAFAIAAIHEQAVAGIVFCVLAALNGQEWYTATFRQSYSVARGELLFSRGGRAVTVLALSGLALIAGTGGIRGSEGTRTGWGLDASLQGTLDDLQKQLQDSLDDRPFHFRPSQGDLLVWIGQRSFVDSRLALFQGQSGGDLIATHLEIRKALLEGDDKTWIPLLDRFQITHVLPRLTQPRPDYSTLFSMLQSRAWQLTSFGASTGVLYRIDAKTPELTRYVSAHEIDFFKQAYKEEVRPVLPRDKWVGKSSFYQKYLGVPPAPIPTEIQESQHLMNMAAVQVASPTQQEPQRALVYLAIRKAQSGLTKNPDCSEGYRVLGRSYLLLSNLDSMYLLNDPQLQFTGLRYFQAVQSLNQALVANPDDYETHRLLALTYQEAGRFELAKQELTACLAILAREKNPSEDQLAEQVQFDRVLDQIGNQVQQLEDDLAQATAGGITSVQSASFAMQRGFPLRALRILDENADLLVGDVAAHQMRITYLLEAGRAQEAFESAAILAEAPQQKTDSQWESIAAMTHLAQGDYDTAIRMLSRARDDLEQNTLARVMEGLVPRASSGQPQTAWPVSAVLNGREVLPQGVSQASQFSLSIALIHVEQGMLGTAARSLRSALESHPNTAARPMLAYYLYLLTGEEIDVLPPMESIPVLFEEDDPAPPA
jgi:tetratricopeptide (TPR) repeat protein